MKWKTFHFRNFNISARKSALTRWCVIFIRNANEPRAPTTANVNFMRNSWISTKWERWHFGALSAKVKALFLSPMPWHSKCIICNNEEIHLQKYSFWKVLAVFKSRFWYSDAIHGSDSFRIFTLKENLFSKLWELLFIRCAENRRKRFRRRITNLKNKTKWFN